MPEKAPEERPGRDNARRHAEPEASLTSIGTDVSAMSGDFAEVLKSAAALQNVVPDAVLVGGTASAIHAGHRVSYDHDHVLQLKERYLAILEAVEATEGCATSVRASKPPMTIMEKLGGIEAGFRPLRRVRPLETQLLDIGDGDTVRIPTRDEVLRVKAYLMVQRNQVRDYLDVAALADSIGMDDAARILLHIGDYYTDRSDARESVASELVMRLAEPSPKDTAALSDLPHYKHLTTRWQDWAEVKRVCGELAQRILTGEGR